MKFRDVDFPIEFKMLNLVENNYKHDEVLGLTFTVKSQQLIFKVKSQT